MANTVRVRLVAALGTGLVLLVVLAAPVRAQVPDHLKCYQVKDTLNLVGTVDLYTPQFGVDPGCKISKAKFLLRACSAVRR